MYDTVTVSCYGKGARTSQRPKRPELVAWGMPRSIATSPWTGCYSIAGLPPSSMSPLPIYTSGWKETKWSTVPCLRKQREAFPDLEIEWLTVRRYTPPRRMPLLIITTYFYLRMFELAQLYNRVNRNSLEQITNSLFPQKLRTTMRFNEIVYELSVEQIACSFSRLLKAYWSKNHVSFVFFSSYSRKASKFCPSPRRESHSAVWAVYVHTKGGIFKQILQFAQNVCLDFAFSHWTYW